MLKKNNKIKFTPTKRNQVTRLSDRKQLVVVEGMNIYL